MISHHKLKFSGTLTVSRGGIINPKALTFDTVNDITAVAAATKMYDGTKSFSNNAAEAEDNVGVVVDIPLHHGANPVEAGSVGGHAFGFGKEQDVVLGGLDADGERVFKALVAVGILVERDHLEVFVVLGEETEDELSVVGGEVVDHDNLEVGIVLLEKIDEVGA